jgi:hypothetical protein
MPATSPEQYKFMRAIEHGMKPKKGGKSLTKKKAKEFADKTPTGLRRAYSKKE